MKYDKDSNEDFCLLSLVEDDDFRFSFFINISCFLLMSEKWQKNILKIYQIFFPLQLLN